MRMPLLIASLLYILLKPLSYKNTQDLSVLDNGSCPEIPRIDSQVKSYMLKYGITGAQLAVMRHDSLLYVKGYGWADKEAEIQMQPNMTMRIASVSKLVTAIGIMILVEDGKLKLEDKVFGPEGILDGESCCSVLRDPMAKRITVEHLLRHQAGFSSKNGDPMFKTGITSGEQAIEWTLRRRLAFMPGTSQMYSNVGYYLLSLIIEKITGQDYEQWMRENVLKPMNCVNFHIAGNCLEDRKENEVCYYMHQGAEFKSEFHGNGNMVPGCYGANNISGLKGAGAWATTAAELCRMIAGIDKHWGIRDILNPESIDRMTEYFDEATFPLGWNDCNQAGVWTRTGSFGGTTAIIRYYSTDGDCWVLLTNTSTFMGPHISKRSSALINRLRQLFERENRTKDLFYR